MRAVVIAVVLGLVIAILVRRRRRRSLHHYSFPERSAVILDALKTRSDLAIVYWSKSQKKYLRRVVTPLDLDLDSLKAFDHSLQDVRLFKVIRIRQITLLSPGNHDAPPRLGASMSVRVIALCALAALVVAVAILFRVMETPAPTRLPEAPTNHFSTLPASVTNRVADLWEVIVDDDANYDQSRNHISQATIQRTEGPTSELYFV